MEGEIQTPYFNLIFEGENYFIGLPLRKCLLWYALLLHYFVFSPVLLTFDLKNIKWLATPSSSITHPSELASEVVKGREGGRRGSVGGAQTGFLGGKWVSQQQLEQRPLKYSDYLQYKADLSCLKSEEGVANQLQNTNCLFYVAVHSDSVTIEINYYHSRKTNDDKDD